MTRWVLDASVAAKWFLPAAREPLADEALHLLELHAAGQAQFRVPDLFWAEFGNLLWKAVRLRRMSRDSAEEALSAMVGKSFSTTPVSALLGDAFAIAATFDCTVYDCIYVALAVAAGIPLLTADERLAGTLASRFPVRWLGSPQE